VLHLDTLPDSTASTLPRLSGLTSLMLWSASDQQCSSLAQLAGLRQLRVWNAFDVSAAGLRQLAALEQLTSLGLARLGWPSDVLKEHMSDTLPNSHGYEYTLSNQVCTRTCVKGGEVLLWVVGQALASQLHLINITKPAFEEGMSTTK